MRFVTLLIASVVLISLPTLSFAQDIGEKDTLWFEYPSDWTILPGCENELAVELWFWTDNSVYGTCLGFKAQTSGEEGVWGPFVDTNLVIDTFIVEPEVKAKAPLTITQSSVICPDSNRNIWGFNGFSVGLLSITTDIFDFEVPTKIGEARFHWIDLSILPDSLSISLEIGIPVHLDMISGHSTLAKYRLSTIH